MLTAILNAIVAIPELIKQIQNLIQFFDKMQVEQRLQNIEEAFTKIQAAQTKQEMKDAAKDLQHSISG